MRSFSLICLATAAVALAGCGSSAATLPPAGATTSQPAPAQSTPAPAQPTTAPAQPSAELPSPVAGGNESAAPGGSSGGAAASLVTADMASAVLGSAATPFAVPGMGEAAGLVDLATYVTGGGDTMVVLVEHLPGGVPTAALQAAMAMAGSNGDLQTIGGIGDAAGKSVNEHDATVAVAKGDTIFVLYAQATAQAGTDLESKLESLAKQVLPKV